MAKHPITFGACLMWLVTSPAAFGQTGERRIEDVSTEIVLLKRVIADQDRRIAELEKAVSALQLAANTTPQSSAKDRAPASVQASGAAPWKAPSPWGRVKEGMSRSQVEAILGRPTSVETLVNFQTLFYRGDVPGSGTVTGTVKLMDDRVWEVNVPVF